MIGTAAVTVLQKRCQEAQMVQAAVEPGDTVPKPGMHTHSSLVWAECVIQVHAWRAEVWRGNAFCNICGLSSAEGAGWAWLTFRPGEPFTKCAWTAHLAWLVHSTTAISRQAGTCLRGNQF